MTLFLLAWTLSLLGNPPSTSQDPTTVSTQNAGVDRREFELTLRELRVELAARDHKLAQLRWEHGILSVGFLLFFGGSVLGLISLRLRTKRWVGKELRKMVGPELDLIRESLAKMDQEGRNRCGAY